MSFSVKEYDADQVLIAVAGIAISQGAGQSGYADGEFLSLKFPAAFTMVKGTDGSVARSKTNDRTIEISLNLLQTNSSNAALSALHLSDVNAPNGAGIGSFVMTDLAGTSLLICTTAWIRQPADITLDRGAKGRSWVFDGVWSLFNVGGN